MEEAPRWPKDRKRSRPRDFRISALSFFFFLFTVLIVAKLFILQVIDHSFYEALASGQHELFQELFPERGDIFVHDYKDNLLVAAATDKRVSFVYADPRQISDPVGTAEKLAAVFGWDQETVESYALKFSNHDDPYEPIKHNVDDAVLAKIEALNLSGISSLREALRYYPEAGLGGHVLGFLGSNNDGSKSGKYGIEGYFDSELAGTPGFLRSEGDVAGRIISAAERAFQPAVDGADVVLTIDRNIQYFACAKLQEAVEKHGADSGSVVIVEPSSGRLLAVCGVPDFDPNNYGQVADISQFNNPVTFNAYEPGSVFKPVTMAAALDSDAVEPTTTYEDTGSVMVSGWSEPISNAENKTYGLVSMTQVLEESINTGVIFAMRAAGQDKFIDYVQNFGFGQKTGVELQSEAAGDLSSLLDEEAEVYSATAAFGQGITVTTLQLAMSYAAIANGGILYQPLVVDEIKHSDGRTERRVSRQIRRVISERAARLLGAMLVSVVESGHGKRAGVSGYYIAGKTGTAQVAKSEGVGYESGETIGTFAGFGPVSNPKFVMVTRLDHPRDVEWAESTAAPLFGEIADFLLKYYEVPPER